jgi:hypothetical protein
LGLYTLKISDGTMYTIAACSSTLSDYIEQNCSCISINNSIIRLHKFESYPSIYGKGERAFSIDSFELVEHSSSTRIGNPQWIGNLQYIQCDGTAELQPMTPTPLLIFLLQ